MGKRSIRFSRANPRTWMTVYALLMLLVLLVFRDFFTLGYIVLGNDVIGDFYHWRLFLHRALEVGHIPEWDPYVFAGQPFIAATQSAVFYPLNLLIYKFFNTSAGINLEILFHLIWLGWGTIFLLQTMRTRPLGALLGGALSVFAPAVMGQIAAGHLAQLAALAWIPWALAGIERLWRCPDWGPALLIALALGGSLLGGHPQYTFYLGVGGILYFFFRGVARGREGVLLIKRVVLFGAGGIALGLLIASAQLFPTLEVRSYLTRSGADYAFAIRYEPPAAAWMGLLFPEVKNVAGQETVFAWWGGAWVLAALALLNRKDKLSLCFAGVGFVALLLAAHGLGFFALAYKAIPGFASFRMPSRILVLFYLMLACLAGRGLSYFMLVQCNVIQKVFLQGLVVVILTAVVWFACADITAGRLDVLATVFSVIAVVLIVWLTQRDLQGRPRFVPALLIMGIILFQGISFAQEQFVVRRSNWFEEAEPLTQVLQNLQRSDRYMVMQDVPVSEIVAVPFLNRGIDYRLRNFGGSDAVVLRSFQTLFNISQGKPPMTRALVFWPDRADRRLLDVLAVRYVLATRQPFGTEPLIHPGTVHPTVGVYIRPAAAKLFALADAAYWVRPQEMAMQLNAAADAGKTLVAQDGRLPGAVAAVVDPPDDADRFLDVITGEGTASAVVRLHGRRLVTYAESYYPGWAVMVDGTAQPLQLVNAGIMGVVVPPGEHEVRFRFASPTVRWGLRLSILATLIWLLSGGWYLYRKFMQRVAVAIEDQY